MIGVSASSLRGYYLELLDEEEKQQLLWKLIKDNK